MAMKSGFFNSRQIPGGGFDREYDAQDFAKCLSGFMGSGVVGKNRELSNAFLVEEGSGSPCKSVFVNPGFAWIDGRWAEEKDGKEFEVDMPTQLGTVRADAIFVRCDYEQREFSIVYRKGEEFNPQGMTPEDYPIPEPQDDEEAKEIMLASLVITDSSTDMSTVFLNDEREFVEFKLNDKALGGLVFKKCTQAEYDAMSVHYSDTIYVIVEEEEDDT